MAVRSEPVHDPRMSERTKLRVLLVTHGLPPESVGGVEQHVDGLARALTEAGHDVRVWAKTGRAGPPQGTTIDDAPGTAPYAVTRFVYRYEGLGGLDALYAVPSLDRAFAEFLDAHAPFDVAHVHHLTGVSTGVVDVLRARRVPVVLSLHDYWLMCPRGQMWHREGRVCDTVEPARCADCLRPTFGGFVPAGAAGETVLARLHAAAVRVLDRADALVVPSARVTAPFEALGVPRERFTVVENGVDTESLAGLALPDPPRELPLRVGYLGTLIPSKGLEVLVAAVGRLPAGTAELHVHGNAVPYHGDHGYLTRVFGALRPSDRVTYHGPYTTGDLARILAGLDVVVAPALWREAFGLTVREALAAGRPVIVSRIGGLQDAVADGVAGRVVPPGDPAALAAAIAGLATDRDRLRAMAAAARGTAGVRSFAAMAAELLAVYARVGPDAPPSTETPPSGARS